MRDTPACIMQAPEQVDEKAFLEVQIGTIKCMLIDFYAKYTQAWNDGNKLKAERYDGSIRALHAVLEAHGL